LKDHYILTECCKAKSNVKPNSLLAILAGESCPHTFYCINCGRPHASDAHEYPFFKHQMDCEWIVQSYQAIFISLSSIATNFVALKRQILRRNNSSLSILK